MKTGLELPISSEHSALPRTLSGLSGELRVPAAKESK